MKHFLPLFILFFSFSGWAADPSTSASNVNFSYIDGAQFSLSFTAGSGNGRIVVVKEGSDITGVPVDGHTYTNNSNQSDAKFGIAGMEFTAPGEYVVYRGSANSNIRVTNLKPGTRYYVAIFEYSTTGTPNPDYSTVTPVGRFVTTLSAPTTQAVITSITAVTGNSLRVNWTNGNGQSRIVVGRKGNSLTATPVDFKVYAYNRAFGLGASANFILDAETFVLVNTNGSPYVDVTNLEPNTTYTFAVYEYNGANTPVYLTTTVTQSITTHTGPSLAPTTMNFSTVDGNRLDFNWNRGNGSKTLVVVKKGSPVVNVPVNGVTYTANTAFNTPAAEWYPNSDEFVVSSSDAASVALTGLEKSTLYYFAVFAFDADANGYTYYHTTPFTKSQSTALPPTAQTAISVSTVTGNTAQLVYTSPASGFGSSRLLVIKEGGPIDFQPTDFVKYSSLTETFGAGQLVAPDTYVLYGQTNGGAPNIKGLKPGHTYHLALFEMNGFNAPVYKMTPATVVVNVPNEPTTSAHSPLFMAEGNAIRIDWQMGDGARRIVVARKGAAVASVPQDGTTYVSAAKFGDGTSLSVGTGEYVVYDGANSSVIVTGLEKATTYHFAVFEYNLSGSHPDYLTTAGKWLATSRATLSAPLTQVSQLSASNIQSTQATIQFTVGTGSSRIFVMREAEPVNAEPEDFKTYSNSNGTMYVPGTEIGTGNYVIGLGNRSSFIVSGLKAGTRYHVTAFEFNGTSGPVYLRPGAASYSFTTTGGINVPTQAAHTPVFENVEGNRITLKWSNGNGANRIVVARKASVIDFVPADGALYTANPSFGTNTDQGGGQFVVFNGNGSSVTLTNLEASTTYHFAIFEYNGGAGTAKYLSSSPLTINHSTATAPHMAPSAPQSIIGTNSITLSWTNGSGEGRLVVAKEASEVTAVPANLSAYTANAAFGNGPQLANGEYVVYAGPGNFVTVTGLTPGKNYHFAVFEFSGSAAPVYNTTAFLKTMVAASSLPVTWVAFTGNVANNKVILNWITSHEVNNSGFEVERSADGVIFQKVGAMKPNQTSTYQFVDEKPLALVSYYRIKQMDWDGQYAYSKVIKIQNGQVQANVSLLQNPVHEQLKVQSSLHLLGGHMQIVNTEGRSISTHLISSTLQIVPVPALTRGAYYLVITNKNGERMTVVSFIKK